MCFDNPTTCPGSGTTVVTWIAAKQTAHTPTSKVKTITDADNRTTTTAYDNADRTHLPSHVFVADSCALRGRVSQT